MNGFPADFTPWHGFLFDAKQRQVKMRRASFQRGSSVAQDLTTLNAASRLHPLLIKEMQMRVQPAKLIVLVAIAPHDDSSAEEVGEARDDDTVLYGADGGGAYTKNDRLGGDKGCNIYAFVRSWPHFPVTPPGMHIAKSHPCFLHDSASHVGLEFGEPR